MAAIARRYRHRGLEFSDLLQEGNLRLMRAVDPSTTGAAALDVRQVVDHKAITYAIADRARTVRIGGRGRGNRQGAAHDARLAHDLGREPNRLAEQLQIPIERVERLIELSAGVARDRSRSRPHR